MSVRDEAASWEGSTVLGVAVAGLTVLAAAALTAGAHLWAALTGADLPWNPIALAAALAAGRPAPTAGLWACTAGVVAASAAVAALVRLALRGRRPGTRTRADSAAALTGAPSDTEELSERSVRAKAARLGAAPGAAFGLPIGRAVRTGRRLWSDLEAVCIVIAGPRTGKTTCWAVPRIGAAPGAVVATSNKRDILDSTRADRSGRGDVWVFDPQGIADEPQSWWWDPMSCVTDAVAARALTEVFVDSTRDPKAQTNAYFDSAARDLVAALLLAAARSGRPITQLHGWLNDQHDDEPVRLLRDAGEQMMADTLQGTLNLVAETRSGVYGSASTIMSFMLNERAMAWVTPSPWLRRFRPEEFVAGTGTLYCLSQEGRGSASPIVTALTVAVIEAALARARTQPAGRLSTPMLCELDEAANVCRWRELPDLYSHFGSRGILVDTLLQSWSQGAVAWGEAGVKKLWSASNVKTYAGGVAERAFLSDLSDLIGTHWVDSRQTSYSAQGRSSSTSRQSQQRPIASVADLADLPRGRAWVLASGSTAALTELIPHWAARGAGGGRGRTERSERSKRRGRMSGGE